MGAPEDQPQLGAPLLEALDVLDVEHELHPHLPQLDAFGRLMDQDARPSRRRGQLDQAFDDLACGLEAEMFPIEIGGASHVSRVEDDRARVGSWGLQDPTRSAWPRVKSLHLTAIRIRSSVDKFFSQPLAFADP